MSSEISPTHPQPDVDRIATQLHGLGLLLCQQAQAGDWDAVKQTDLRLRQVAHHMASRYPRQWAELAPVRAELRARYQGAVDLCQQEAAHLKEAWQNLHGQREGLAAYDEVLQWQ